MRQPRVRCSRASYAASVAVLLVAALVLNTAPPAGAATAAASRSAGGQRPVANPATVGPQADWPSGSTMRLSAAGAEISDLPRRPSRRAAPAGRRYAATRADLAAGLPQAGAPLPRTFPRMTYDARNGNTVLFSGDVEPGGTYFPDTWLWDGTAWNQVFPATTPSGRISPAMSYDGNTNTVVLFGGYVGAGRCNTLTPQDNMCNDTWTWDGTTWTQLHPAHSPPPLMAATMAYDAATGQLVLYGGTCRAASDPGCDATFTSTATWVWSGSDWSQQAPVQNPSRTSFDDRMAFDPDTGTIVLDVPNTNPHTIFTWDGGTWTPHPAPELGAFLVNAVAYDTVTHSVLAQGNNCVSGHAICDVQATWSWDGQSWSQLQVPQPAVRYVDWAMAYDRTSRQLVVFGGFEQSTGTDVNTTYTFDGHTWRTAFLFTGGALTAAERVGGNPSECACKNPWLRPAMAGDPVDTASGTLVESVTDLAIPGRGPRLNLGHTYSSAAAARDGPLGFGWTFNYGSSLAIDDRNGTVTVNQENGSQVTFTLTGGGYSAPPRVLATLVHNADGSYTLTRDGRTRLTFSSGGQLTEITDLDGYSVSLAYASGQLATVTDAGGRALTFTWQNAHLSTVADPIGRTVVFGYDDAGDLRDVQDVAGEHTRFGYDTAHHLTTVTDPRGGVVRNDYDAVGRVVQQTSAIGARTTFDYDAIPDATRVTDPNGNVRVDYFTQGVRTAVTYGYGTALAATWIYAYDPDTASLTRVVDPNGGATRMTYDPAGNLLTLTDPAGNTTTNTYDTLGDLTTSQDATGVVTTNIYDGTGRLRRTSRPLTGTNQSAVITYDYDPRQPGDLTQVTDADAKIWHYDYDQYGNLAGTTDPLGNHTTITADTAGRVTSVVRPNGNVSGGDRARFTTTYTYDSFDQVLTETRALPGAPQIGYTYDADHNRTSVKDLDGNTTRFVYDLDNRLTETHRPDGSVLKTGYDGHGNVTTQTDPLGHTTMYGYDPLNHLVSVVDPLQRRTTYTVDGLGNRLTEVNARGQFARFQYDANSNVTQAAYFASPSPFVSYSYDKLNRRATMTDGSGRTTYTYDSLGRLTGVTNGAGATVGYGYDLKSQLTSITYPGGTNRVTRGWDDAGRLTSVTDWKNNTVTFDYDADGSLTRATYPGSVARSLSYDDLDRLVHITVARQTAGEPQTLLEMSYNRASSGVLAADQVTVYSYDGADRLTRASGSVDQTYGYDAADRVTTVAAVGGPSATLSYDSADQLQDVVRADGSQTSYGYDADGNRTGQTNGDTSTSLGFDQTNRLLSWGDAASYGYNGDGLRTSKTVSGTNRAFTWDLAQQLPQLLQDADTAFVSGPGGAPLEQVNPDGSVWYLQPDQLGSTRALIDNTGAVVATYDYDAYGNVTNRSGQATTPLRFAGQYGDDESGLYYLRARYYDPATAQFLSRDPDAITTRQSYVYSADSPTNATDPSGLDFWSWLVDAGIAVGRALPPPARQQYVEFLSETGAWVGLEHAELNSGDPGTVAIGVGNVFLGTDLTPDEAQANWDDTCALLGISAKAAQRQVERGWAPRGIDRVDEGRGPNEQDHVHFRDGSALNRDGTWKHGGRALSGSERRWLIRIGWRVR
jgi:RHS repeat-associated protein